MSSNKQSIKLYTEEQVIDIFEKYGKMSAINARNILDLSESIQLPSDEELKKQFDVDEFDPYDVAYLGGAIRMRNLIQGGKNEQQTKIKNF